MDSLKTVGIMAICVVLIIMFITSEEIKNKILNILSKRIFYGKITIKYIVYVCILIMIIIYSIFLINSIINTIVINNNDLKEELSKLDKTIEIADMQLSNYNELMEIDTDFEKCKNPYIPENFTYVEGEWNNGFVIEDFAKNQFVWIPCTNNSNKLGIPILQKHDFNNDHYTNNSSCYEQDDYEAFIKSSLENGGFYISRFEIGKENDMPVSKKDVKIWTDIDWDSAYKISKEMYSNINSRLINGYAFDTAVSFVYDEIDLNDISKSEGISGKKSYKKIYDLVDNMFEWTSEMRHQNKIIRGCVFEEEKLLAMDERYVNDDDCSGDMLSFRIIIYK